MAKGVETGGDSPRLSVGVLGPLLLETATGSVHVGGGRLRALVVRLALEAGRAVSAATLVEGLWGEDAPADPLHALQTLVSRLRRALDDPTLVTSGPAGYRLAIEPGAVDVVRFERLARQGRAQPRPEEVAATLREALSLWRGPSLVDVRYAPFAEAEVERLERAWLAVLEDRVEADLALRVDPLKLVAELEGLAAAHPLRERVHAQLIRALALAGRGGEALEVYQRIRVLLADSFGADPGPQLQEAHLAVLRGEVVQHRRSPGNLDVPLTSFVGRDGDVRRVVDLLDRHRLVTLVGPGGAGKTRLANTIGWQLTPSGGVWFVPLAPVGADDVPRAVLDVLRAQDTGGPYKSVVDRLVEMLAATDLTLVLDNCEHVIDAAAALAATLLARCPRLRILATSREPLRTDGEALYPVPPLELPGPDSTAEEARAAAAVRLFHDRAAAVSPDFSLEAGALTAVVEICRRLDGLPLAIELAAARLRTLPVEAVAARLDDRFRLLTGGSRTALLRHRTLSAAVAWSWDLLNAEERDLLERLSVIPGTFTEEAAEAIGGPGDLAELVDKSLLHPAEPSDPAEPRYRVLETIREYGLARLAQRDEVEAVRRSHAAYYLDLAETADPHLRTSDQLPWLVRLSAERDNLSAAIRWAAESGDSEMAVRLGVALSWFWFMRDHPPESLDLLGRILQVPGADDPLVVAAHALATTEVVNRQEEADAAFDRIREALSRAVPGVHPVLEMARLALAVSSGPDRTAPAARPTDPWSRSLALLVEGVLTMNDGRAAEAAPLLKRAMAGFEELGERWGLATALSTLNAALLRSGDPQGAPVERATRYFRELGMPEHSMENEVAAALRGDEDGGRRHLTHLLDQAGSAESRAQVRLGLARLEWRAGRLDAARAHALAGLADTPQDRSTPHLADTPSDRSTPHLVALLLAVLAQVDAAEGRPDEAVRRLDHPAVRLTLTWHTPVAAALAVAAAAIELGRAQPQRAARLLGAATALRGWDDMETITRQAVDALGAAGFASAHAVGAALSRAEALELVSKVIT